jgi:hypothetical protein
MSDQVTLLPIHGLGAIPSPPDERDYPIDALYAALGVDLPVTLPAAFASVPVPPILDQGLTPQCVAYSTAGMKDFQDYDDQAPARWWNFDEGRFFSLIGGGPNGAILRDASADMRSAAAAGTTPRGSGSPTRGVAPGA